MLSCLSASAQRLSDTMQYMVFSKGCFDMGIIAGWLCSWVSWISRRPCRCLIGDLGRPANQPRQNWKVSRNQIMQ
ncbi:hypothetical protein BDV19DRAFT_230054 [Aspergillus venezuelensis]